jgi:hypothetical protein
MSVMKSLAPIAVLVVAGGCGSESTSPQSPSLAGSYTAFEWVTTGGSGQTNQLVAGSTLQITLNGNGSTTGHMHIAASNGNPTADFDMAGAWTQSGNTVDFTQAADTFVRDMVFTVQPIATGVVDLVGDQLFSGTQVKVTLRRAP